MVVPQLQELKKCRYKGNKWHNKSRKLILGNFWRDKANLFCKTRNIVFLRRLEKYYIARFAVEKCVTAGKMRLLKHI